MASGTELRAQIDSEGVRGLLLINGGGCVALLAFLPTVLGKPEYASLAKCILWALASFQFGLLSAVIHNRHRRVCSLIYDNSGTSPQPKEAEPCRFFGKELREPCACMRSIAFMWVSVLAFLCAGILVLIGGLAVV